MSEVRCPRCGALVEVWTKGPLTCPQCGFTKKVRSALLPRRFPPSRVAVIAVAAAVLVGGIAAGVYFLLPSRDAVPTGPSDAGLRAAVLGTQALARAPTTSWFIELRGDGSVTTAAWSPQGPTLQRTHNDTEGSQGTGFLQSGAVLNLFTQDGSVLLGRDEHADLQDVGDEVFKEIARVFTGVHVQAVATESVGGRPLNHFSGASKDWTVEAWATPKPAHLVSFNATGPEGPLRGTVRVGETLHVPIDATLDERAPISVARNETLSETSSSRKITGRIDVGQRYEVKLAEIELHVAFGDAEASGDPVLTLRLDKGRVSEGGYTITYTDANRDNLLSEGDRYEVKMPADSTETVFFYDLWADAYAPDEAPA